MDFNVKRGNQQRCLFTEEQEQYIIEAYQNGKSKPEIGKEFGTSHKSIERLLRKKGIETNNLSHRKYYTNEKYFEEIDTPNKAYIFGFLCADGNVSPKKGTVSMSLQEEDKYILDRMREEIGIERPLEFIDYTNKHDFGYTYKNQYRLLMFSMPICRDVIRHGMVPNKSSCLEFPEIREDLLSHFVRGYFDGNGTIVDGRFYVTSTASFCYKLKEVLEKELGVNYINIVDASNHNGITKTIFVRKSQSKVIYDWMYKDAQMYLTRKHDKYLFTFYFKTA